MSEPNSQIHPRKLYSTLCESADSRSRAVSALEFLCASMDAEYGFLLLARAGELALSTSSGERALPPELRDRATQLWIKESDGPTENDQTRTVEVRQLVEPVTQPQTSIWTLSSGDRFQPQLLSTYRNDRWVPVGLALLKARKDRSLSAIRRAHVEALCNAFIDSHDVPVETA